MEIRGYNSQFDSISYSGHYRNNGLRNNVNAVEKLNYDNSKGFESRESVDEFIKSIEAANDELVVYDRRFEFSIHEKTKQIMVKIVDVNTDEVVREIPPEKILDLVAALWEISGLIVDEKV